MSDHAHCFTRMFTRARLRPASPAPAGPSDEPVVNASQNTNRNASWMIRGEPSGITVPNASLI